MSNIKQDLIDAGYREHRNDTYKIFKNTNLLYQKRISDMKGVLYYLNCWVYEKDGDIFKEDSPQFEVQYTMTDGEKCDVAPFHKDIAEVERFFLRMWERMEFGYYELFH